MTKTKILMKTVQRNSIHLGKRSYDVLIVEINGKKVKFTYEAANAEEKCTTELFDGYKFNHIFSLMDLGEMPDNSAYNVMSEKQRKLRATKLFTKAEKMISKLLNI